jgi:hypothetical protein
MGFLLAPPARQLKSVDGGAKADKSQRTKVSHRFAPIAKITKKQRLIASGFAQVPQKCLDSVSWLQNLRRLNVFLPLKYVNYMY